MKSSETALGIIVLTFPACMGTRWLTNNYFDYTGQIDGPYNSDFMRLVFIAGIFCFINAGAGLDAGSCCCDDVQKMWSSGG